MDDIIQARLAAARALTALQDAIAANDDLTVRTSSDLTRQVNVAAVALLKIEDIMSEVEKRDK